MAEWIERPRVYQPYTGFSFICDYGAKHDEDIEIHSSQLNLYRVSDGSRYNEDMSAAFQDKTVQAPGRDGTFYFGTNYTQRTFNIQIAFDSMTEDDMHEFRRIFAAKEEGYLIFDEMPYKQYKVKIQTVPQLKYIVFDEEVSSTDTSKILNTNDLNGNAETDDSWRQGGRTYKGEGTLQFVAYYPFAIERYGRYKFLSSYCNPNSSNLLPTTYYSKDVLSKNGIDYEVDKSGSDSYGDLHISGLRADKDKDTAFNFCPINSITLKKNVTYYINNTGTTLFRYHLNTKDSTSGKYTILAKTESTTTDLSNTWISYRPTKTIKAYTCVVVYQSTETLNNTFFPVLTTQSSVYDTSAPDTNYLSWLHENYGLKTVNLNQPYSWAFDFNTWKKACNMKESQYSQEDGVTTLTSPLSYDIATRIVSVTNQLGIYATTAGIFSQGMTAIKVCNAGEVDSDVEFYCTWSTTGPTRVRPNNIFLIKETKDYDENGSKILTYQVLNTITIGSNFKRISENDNVLRFNSKANLLEGGNWVYNSITKRNEFVPTGNIYNRYITSGEFFKIPSYEFGTNYYICATPMYTFSTTQSTALCLSNRVEYHHVWY